MTRLSTMPSAREQAYRALTLLGVPAAARLIVQVHGALFPGDLTVAALTELVRQQGAVPVRPRQRPAERPPYRLCLGLAAADLTPAGGLIALSTWALTRRLVTATSARVDLLTAVVRVAEFAAVQPGASPSAARLLRGLADVVPGGPEAYDVMNPGALADAARAALAEPAFVHAAAQDRAVRDAAAEQALARLDDRQLLFGVRILPRQPGAGGADP
jgi:hypothetical protein